VNDVLPLIPSRGLCALASKEHALPWSGGSGILCAETDDEDVEPMPDEFAEQFVVGQNASSELGFRFLFSCPSSSLLSVKSWRKFR
jgi:hypothetical protein